MILRKDLAHECYINIIIRAILVWKRKKEVASPRCADLQQARDSVSERKGGGGGPLP